MKTPRDILFARHQAAVPKLDVIRREVVNAELRDRGFATLILEWPMVLWRELVFPSRRIWTGLATVWILIFIIDFSQRDPLQTGAAKVSAPEIMSFGEQQKLVNELLADRSLPVDVERPKVFSPKPRTEAVKFETV